MLHLAVEPERLAVCRLAADAPLAAWMWTGPLASVTRRGRELSVVCSEAAVPEGVEAEPGWRALTVAGPLDFALTGVLASLAVPLAAAGVPIFVLSTFETDAVLVRDAALPTAVDALGAAGHTVEAGATER